ncbi:trypsin-like serine protease [Streptomyces sp. BE20]|uniref:trypsin-like serine protease n=1 Tax=Streptomyces sp. BE20 TaxID=3002525 RepID=UPI002E7A647D|nr:trypsin-like serine protease [Streptomyces sp. BE20]MEE1821603.1 trypsin-like serine protease [Streptomyces sp. BE20]
MAGSMPASAAEATPPLAVENFSYPGAAQILAQQHAVLKSGDGNIQLADCTSTDNMLEVYSRTLDLGPTKICFRVTGPGGYLAVELPKVYSLKGDDHTVKATLTTDGSVSSLDLRKNYHTPVGEGSAVGGITLLELSATDGPAAPAITSDYPAVGSVVIGQPGRAGGRACTATLVDRHWALTSAGCFTDNPATLTAGAPASRSTVTIGGRSVDIAELVPRTDRDLVMARLAVPVDSVTPAALATTAPVAGENVSVPGFGRTATQWRPYTSHTATHTTGAITATGIDSTPAPGSSAICAGDAGSPLLRTGNGAVQIVGVASRSWQGGCFGGTETRTGATSTRVDDLAGWVQDLRYRTSDVYAGTHVQIIGSDDKLYDSVADYTSGLWTRGWTSTGDSRLLAVDSVATGDTVHVYAVLTDYRVYSRDGKIGGRWGAWSEVPGGAVAADGAQKITAAVRGNTGLVDVEIIGSDGSLYGTTADYGTGTWRPTWGKIGDNRLTAVTSAYFNNATHVFAINEDGKVYTRTGNYTTGSWGTDWIELPGSRPGVTSISAAVHGTTVDLSIAGADTFYSTSGHFDTGLWDQQWTPMGDNHLTVLTSTTSDNVVHVYAVNEDKKVYTRDANYNTGLWTAWKEIPGDATGVKAITAASTG